MSEHLDTASVGAEPSPGHRYETLAEGAIVGDRYEIRRRLGVGGSSVVYAAFDRHLRREVALKVLRTDRFSERALTRLRREVNVARDVRSPHLVSVYDIGQIGDSAWITMELIDGDSLGTLLRNGVPEVERVVDIARQLLAGLAALHEHGIVHRDVKPGNVLITPDGNVRIADFGLARRWDGSDTRATATEDLVGTAGYLSPEQALGLSLDARSDLYSFGVLLYELLTGELPFRGESSIGTVVRHLHVKVPNVRTKRPEVPTWLATVVSRLLEKRRENRYQSATEVLRDVQSRKTDWKFALRKARVKLVLAAAFILAIAGAWVGWNAWSDSRFDRLVLREQGRLEALDKRGRTLWSVPWPHGEIHAAVTKFGPWKPKRIVTILADPHNSTPDQMHTLSILDAQTGEVVRAVTLPQSHHVFAGFSNHFNLGGLRAVDVDHDGLEQIVISFFHTPYWPSYSVLYDPSIDDAWTIFRASGRHRLAGTADLDGNGIDELIFYGVNNRMGWYDALAAVSVTGNTATLKTIDPGSFASTPDAEYASGSLALEWYALIPSPFRKGGDVVIDETQRRIVVRYPNGEEVFVGFDGFVVDSESPLPSDERLAARTASYAALREGIRLMESGLFAEAYERVLEAGSRAEDIGDGILSEWIVRNEIRALIGLGRIRDARGTLERLTSTATAPGDVAYHAARAFHLEGHLDLATSWYSKGMALNAALEKGRQPHEFLEGAVLALGELDRWGDAERVIRQYEATYPEITGYYPAYLRSYIEWRTTGRISSIPDVFAAPDLQRYWTLEAVALGKIDESFLREIDGEIKRSSETDVLLRALRAEILHRLGDSERAAHDIALVYHDARLDRDRSTAIRAHFDLIEHRYERLTGIDLAESDRPSS